ncbi:MAG TPA: hypothetical protein VM165_25005, partial [Planctomycetaceae bacterium]|nr:hypothetical protein [Planctomycetaceae bacterium]
MSQVIGLALVSIMIDEGSTPFNFLNSKFKAKDGEVTTKRTKGGRQCEAAGSQPRGCESAGSIRGV